MSGVAIGNPEGHVRKVHIVAASNNRNHPTRSLHYCLFVPHTYIFVLCAHPVRGESHNQRNTTGEVATADCEIFQSESSPDPIKLNPIQSWSVKFLKIISPIQSWSTNVKLFIFILPHEAKELLELFAFSHIRLVEGKILPAMLLPHEAKQTQPFGISKI